MSEPIALPIAQPPNAELVGSSSAGEMTGLEVFSTFSGDFDVFRMLGALELLKARIMARVE